MKKSFVAAALVAGLVGPASAATGTLDFTKDNLLGGFVGGIGYGVSAQGGGLVNSLHGNDADCAPYECVAVGNQFDVGFGITGSNGNEIDAGSEAVIVTFTSLVKIIGFAGMLTYFDDESKKPSYETVQLEYSTDGGSTWLGLGAYLADALESGNPFDTVGLAYLDNLSIIANAVRYTATGAGNSDDGSFNVTAAGLKVASVPIPASFPLLLAGLGALGFAARRKQRKSA